MELQLLELVPGILTLAATAFLAGYRIGFTIGKQQKSKPLALSKVKRFTFRL